MARRPARAALLAAAACLWAGTAWADPTDNAVSRANRMAYESAMRCFVANGYASDQRRKAGDSAKEALYRAKARQSFDLTYTAGEKIGLSDRAISRDLDFYQDTELPKMVRDESYFLSAVATCKALGLM